MTNSSLSDNHQLLIPPEGYNAAAVVLFLIGFFGFSLNLTVIIFLWREKQLWTPINMIILNLVVTDFLVSVLGNPWTFMAAVKRNWMFGGAGCVFYGFIMALLGIASIITLTVLAFERYLMIARPFRNNALNFGRIQFTLGVIWGYSLALTVPPLLGWGEYGPEAANISCSVNWEKQNKNTMTYILYLFTFGLFIPLTIIIFSYTNILIKVRKSAFRMGQVNKAENKVAYMVFIMIAAFLTAWSPYAILALVIQFGDASFVTPGMAVLPALLAKSSICYNPVIYIGMNNQFQNIWRDVCCRSNQRDTSRDELATSHFVTHARTETSKLTKFSKDVIVEVPV